MKASRYGATRTVWAQAFPLAGNAVDATDAWASSWVPTAPLLVSGVPRSVRGVTAPSAPYRWFVLQTAPTATAPAVATGKVTTGRLDPLPEETVVVATLPDRSQQRVDVHGAGSVVGLAPSAAAADVLGDALRIPTENTAKWLVERDRESDRLTRLDRARASLRRAPDRATARTLAAHVDRLAGEVEQWRFHPGQLVIVDEASLAGTLTLDRLAACAGETGAKLLLVGDWAQLSSIEAGGAFGLLVRDRGASAPELDGVRRFTEPWEREASTRLRLGDIGVVDTFIAHDRVAQGDQVAMVESAYAAWAADECAGRRSLLLAGDLDTVRTLNERARADLVAAGRVEAAGTNLRDGLQAGAGDRIVTRRNDRHLTTDGGWVKNGDQWVVTRRGDDGALDVRRPAGGPVITLPATYVAQHVDLAYATTAFRAQGATVDTAHAVVTGPGMTREVLYVMLTRARESNRIYVCTDRAAEPLHGFADEPLTGRSVLAAVLRNTGESVSAHETIEAEQDNAASIRTLAAEYETLAHVAQAPRWTELLSDAGLTPDQLTAVEASPAFGALCVTLRRAEAHSLPVTTGMPRLVHHAPVGAEDLAAVLHTRVENWVAATLNSGADLPRLIAGLIPAAVDVAEFATALAERARLIEQRANVLVDRANAAGARWLRDLGERPSEPTSAAAWQSASRAVAAYRDRYEITDPDRPLGSAAGVSERQTIDRARAAMLLTELRPAPTERASTANRPQFAAVAQEQCRTLDGL